MHKDEKKLQRYWKNSTRKKTILSSIAEGYSINACVSTEIQINIGSLKESTFKFAFENTGGEIAFVNKTPPQ